jgi:hypothetical protein
MLSKPSSPLNAATSVDVQGSLYEVRAPFSLTAATEIVYMLPQYGLALQLSAGPPFPDANV